MTALSEPLMGENVGSPDASRKGQSIVSPQSGPMAHRFLGLGAAVLYGFTAVSMNFVNKASMQMMPLPNVVMVIQMVATFLILQPLLELGVVDFPRFSWQTCRRLFWITALYTANVGFALFGLRTLNVPMYNVLKRLTPMIVLTVKAIIKRRAPQLEVSLSVAMVVTGCVVAGVGDLSFDLVVSASAEPLAGGGGSKEGGSSASLLLMGGGFNGTAGVVSSAALSAMEEQPMTREGAHVVTETAWGAGAVRRHAIA
ncbi:UDP-N-acetylglucosamine/UDP-glucose/GDP-mannose transporter [Tetrabaena socialis]|uniref:UDP-N-acetylglucosamine/UDP-glucose/GDP-mannose transporter n=1 Tax=Tetrabaena socialis TaxID=47790 RepID=A0A2J8AEL1_9CHLO|nr:UDP-N-acetylglucosamine/UDP-glucose/GDP-mannose transporter [Tetrabaena socialis]|eukprot:PNH10960.1 UDP-N-acetylglucosamine/UDP-glucose/GDP-mannose transporter [Tetrabaena socialis]